MSLRTVSKWLLVTCIVALVVWTTIAGLIGVPGDQISPVVRDFCEAYPILAFGAGVVVGHWLWPLNSPRRDLG